MQDYTQAKIWYEKAADWGSAAGQYYLAQCYENGWGVAIDMSQANEYHQLAIDNGYGQG